MNATTSGTCYACFAHAVRGDVCGECGATQREKRNLRALPLWSEIDGRYRLGKVLGAGGFGITYLAKDTQLGRRVAVKEYFPNGLASRPAGHDEVVVNCSDDEAPFLRGLKRFFSEGTHMARFTHPNIVVVHDVLEGNSTAYLVMQYQDGKTLKAELRDAGRLTSEHALYLMQFVLDALKAVHREGLVHRDVKPDNIYLTDSGRVLLLDFGGAKQLFSESERTASGDTMFAHGYAAPEQYFSEADQINATTDVYGAAATLYHLLTGQRMPGALEREREGGLNWHDSDVSPAVRAIVAKALQLEQKDRYPSIEAFSDQLAAAAPLPVSLSQPGTDAGQTASRRSWLIGGAASGAVVASGAWWLLMPRGPVPGGGAVATPVPEPLATRHVLDRLGDMRGFAGKSEWRKVDDEVQVLRQCCAAKGAEPDKPLLAAASTASAQGQFASARRLLEQAVLKSPGAAEPWAVLAFVLMRLREALSAKQAALQALSLDAGNPTAWSALAEALGDAPPGDGAAEAAQLAVYFSADRANMSAYLRESPFRSAAFRDIISGMGNRLDQVPARAVGTR